jgi:predicted HicB family RNase H-like nuclease
VSKEHHKELKRIAVEEETSLNDIVYTLIKDYLTKRK